MVRCRPISWGPCRIWNYLGKKQGRKWADINRDGLNAPQTIRLPRTDMPFVIAISRQLDNKFCFKDLKQLDLRPLHNFLEKTVAKQLTILAVDGLYMRAKDSTRSIEINGGEYQVVHFGIDNDPFRIFRYFAPDGYFHLTRIDPRHNTH